MTGFQKIVEKIIHNEPFREALLTDPAGVLSKEGVVLNAEVLAAFEDVTPEDLKALAENFNESDAAR